MSSDTDPAAHEVVSEQPAAFNKPIKADLDHRKPCTLCSRLCNVRIRCQIDTSGRWHLVCPGKCWQAVSGGVIDGDKDESHKYYRYGGVWKNKHDAVSGKKPKESKKQKAKAKQQSEPSKGGGCEEEKESSDQS